MGVSQVYYLKPKELRLWLVSVVILFSELISVWLLIIYCHGDSNMYWCITIAAIMQL